MRVDIYLSAPVSLTSPLHLDALLALCWHIDNGRYEMPAYKEEYIKEQLPLKQTEGVWHTSAGFVVGTRKKDVWHKRFLFNYERMIDFGKKQKAVRTGSGHHRSYSMPIVYIPTEKITFFADGDAAEVERLLRHLPGIGKKRAIGFGLIKSVEVNKQTAGKALTYNNKAMRTLPSGDYDLESRTQMLACRLPYHDAKNNELCYVPEWLFKTPAEFEAHTGEYYEVHR